MRKLSSVYDDFLLLKLLIVVCIVNILHYFWVMNVITRATPRSILHLICHIWVGEERFEARDDRKIDEGLARPTFGIASWLRTVRTGIMRTMRAHKAAARVNTAIIEFRLEARELSDPFLDVLPCRDVGFRESLG